MKTKPKEFILHIASSRKNIHQVEEFFHAVNSTFQLPDERLHALLVAVTEAVNNGIIHGNNNDAAKFVTVKCSRDKNSVTIKVKDEGKGFNPKNVSNPLDEENLLRTGGRGVFLMKSFMQSVTYNKRGNEVTMTLEV